MNRLKQLRMEANESQEDVGRLIGVSGQAVGQYELEKRGLSQDKIITLANHYNCSTDYFLGKSDIRNPEEYNYAYHKESEGLTDEEVADALRFYKEMKNKMKGNNN